MIPSDEELQQLQIAVREATPSDAASVNARIHKAFATIGDVPDYLNSVDACLVLVRLNLSDEFDGGMFLAQCFRPSQEKGWVDWDMELPQQIARRILDVFITYARLRG